MRALSVVFFVLLTASSSSAQNVNFQLESVGLGRSRLRCTIVERRGVPAAKNTGSVSLGRVEFRDQWLQKELPRLFPDLSGVDIVDRALVRTSPSGCAATAERFLEIVGPTSSVEAASAVIRRVLAEPMRTLKFKIWAAIVRFPVEQKRPPSTQVKLLGQSQLEQRLEEIARDESATMIETGGLEFLNGRSASMSAGSRVSYVKDYKLSQAGDRLFLEPVVDNFKEGMTWSIGAVYDSPAKSVFIDSHFKFVQVQRPIPKFRGKVGWDDRELVIEKPILAETSWNSEGLVCGTKHAGFVVSGIRLRDVTQLAGVGRKAEVVLIVRFDVERLSGERILGSVQGYDRATKLAFVQVTQSVSFEKDMKIEFLRHNASIAKGRVVEMIGNVVTVYVDEGEVIAGDQIR